MRVRATVNGEIPFTPEEEAAFEADILAASQSEKPKPINAESILDALLRKGVITENDLNP